MATLQNGAEAASSSSPPSKAPPKSTSPSPSLSEGDERKENSFRHSRYSAVEDLKMVREVAATKAHIAPYGQTKVLYEKVAERCNLNGSMKSVVTWKQCQDRYKRLQDMFNTEDGLTQVRSGIGGGQLSELNELLSQLKEARDDLKQEKTARKEKVTKEEEEKERIGKDLVAASMSRKRKLPADYKSGDEVSSSDSGSGSKGRKKRKRSRNGGMGGELAAFGESLRDSDLARIEFEREQLAFQRHKYDLEREDRAKDREERREERKEANDMELQKLQELLSAFRHTQK